MLKRSEKENKSKKLPVIMTIIALFLIILFAFLLNLKGQSNKSQTRSSSSAHTVSTIAKTSSKPVEKPWLTSNGQVNQLPILMFHYVNTQMPDSNTMTPEIFESDLKSLVDQGYYTVNSTEALRILTTNEKPSNKMIWLTFDDGSIDLYTTVFPLLKKYHLHATAMIVTGNLANGTVTEAQIKEMKASGLIDFQSHTVSHIDLSTADDASATLQLQQSKAWLDQTLHQKTSVICYPAGKFSAQTEEIAKSLGYKIGLQEGDAIAEGNSNLFEIPRLRMSSGTNAQLLMQMIQPAESYNVKNTAP